MAREHARIKLSIWDDAQFRELSVPAQHLYFVLLSHNKLDYAGVTDWRPARLSAFAGAWSTEAVETAAQELSEQLYLIIDEDTEEVLVRSFVRNDGFMDQPNMAVAMRKAHRSVASPDLRAVIVHELVRLHDDKPELKGWPKVLEMLSIPSLDPSDRPPFKPSGNPSGMGQPNPSGNPSGQPSPTTAPNSLTQLPAPNNTTTGGGSLEGDRYETLRPVSATKPPTCSTHPNGDFDGPCAGCKRVREYGDKLEAEAKRAAAIAAANCRDCHGTNWAEDEEGNPKRKCDHRRTA
jgi:hypothetical protein